MIDWTKAPKGATHYDPADNSESCWMMKVSEKVWAFHDTEFWTSLDYADIAGDVHNFIARPTEPQPSEPPKGATHYMPFPEGLLWYDLRYQQVWQNDEWQPSELIRLGHLDWSKLVSLGDEVMEWDGNSRIEVGQVLEARAEKGNPWLKCTVSYISSSGVVISPSCGGSELFWRYDLFDVEFRPIRTKEQQERDELHDLVLKIGLSLK